MTDYKAIATITWKFSCDKSAEECVHHARAQLEKILECHPQGDEFDGFSVQVDIAQMKERKRLVHIAAFDIDDILQQITEEESKKEFVVNNQVYLVKMNSQRYHVFKQSRTCCSCGLEGKQMILDINPGDQSPHFNLYGEEDGRLVLMTKDHIMPKSKGGADTLENYRTYCSICNNLKGADFLSNEQVALLREAARNHEKLPRSELQGHIKKLRDSFSSNGSSNDDKAFS
jgi:5-methylcytosine-specific restriction endonuclease McrA